MVNDKKMKKQAGDKIKRRKMRGGRRRKQMDGKHVTNLRAVSVNWPYCLAERC